MAKAGLRMKRVQGSRRPHQFSPETWVRSHRRCGQGSGALAPNAKEKEEVAVVMVVEGQVGEVPAEVLEKEMKGVV